MWFSSTEQLKELKQEYMKQEGLLQELKKNRTSMDKKLEFERLVGNRYHCACHSVEEKGLPSLQQCSPALICSAHVCFSTWQFAVQAENQPAE